MMCDIISVNQTFAKSTLLQCFSELRNTCKVFQVFCISLDYKHAKSRHILFLIKAV